MKGLLQARRPLMCQVIFSQGGISLSLGRRTRHSVSTSWKQANLLPLGQSGARSPAPPGDEVSSGSAAIFMVPSTQTGFNGLTCGNSHPCSAQPLCERKFGLQGPQGVKSESQEAPVPGHMWSMRRRHTVASG